MLIRALELAGHRVALASRFCSRDGGGDPARQARLESLGEGLAERLLRRYRAGPATVRPEAWLTYHLYYKAPDWLGPAVARGLGIPYLAAEASVAPKRAGGPWDLGHRATLEALEAASLVIALNPADLPCLPASCRSELLLPFLDPEPGRKAAAAHPAHRAALAASFGLDPARPVIAAVAMMRPGDKLDSYRLLAAALDGLEDRAWQLLIVGDGPARTEVEAAFAPLGGQVKDGQIHFAGAVEEGELPGLLAGADLFAWPAVREAYGMALLEAQAAGLPVVASREGGVPAIVADGETGLLAEPRDPAAFRGALERLLADPALRQRMGAAALAKVAHAHSLERASAQLDGILASLGAAP